MLVLREVTERREAISFGTARLIGTDSRQVEELSRLLLDNEEEYLQMANAVNPYGDGMAAERIIQAIYAYFGSGDKPEDFSP